MSFPDSIETFTRETDYVTDATAVDINAVYTLLEAIQNFLGTTSSPALKLDNLAEPDDNTDLDASTTRHGLLKKLDNNAEHFLNGVGNWATPVVGNIAVSAGAIWPATTNGAAALEKKEYTTNDLDLQVLAFDKDSDEYGQFTIILPDDWDGGTLTAKIYWSCASGDGGADETVCWTIQGRSIGNDEAIDQAWGTAQSVSDTWLADDKLHISDATSAITLAGTPAAGEYVQFRISRDVSEDTLGGDAILLGIKLTFSRSYGS